MSMTLWHCHNARSLRALWALEEMGFEHELVELPFPPRIFDKSYLEVNPLGTVPFFKDGDVEMTESSGIPLYLVERYKRYDFGLQADHPEYGAYLNWMFHSDATLTFPQTIVIRYRLLEPADRQLPQAAEDYRKWYHARLRKLGAHLQTHEYLVDNRFTVADIDIAYALYLGETLGFAKDYEPHVNDYLQRMKARDAFQKVVVIGEENSNFKDIKL